MIRHITEDIEVFSDDFDEPDEEHFFFDESIKESQKR